MNKEGYSFGYAIFLFLFIVVITFIGLFIWLTIYDINSEKALVKSVYNIENILLSDSSQNNDAKDIFYGHIIRPITEQDFESSIIEFKDKIKGSKKEKEILDEIYNLVDNTYLKTKGFNMGRKILNEEYLKRKK